MQSRFSRLIWVAPDVTATLDQKLLIAHSLTRRTYERTLVPTFSPRLFPLLGLHRQRANSHWQY